MITRDEREYVAEAIRSVRGLAGEVIVVDTGSEDETASIAEAEGARVFHREWNSDFSEARNFSIEKASGDWILILDADEAIDRQHHENIRGLITVHPDKAFMFVQKNYSMDSSTFGWQPVPENQKRRGALGYHTSSQVRLFRNKDIYYSGRIHEGVERSLEQQGIEVLKIESVSIHHYGRMKGAGRVKRKHRMYLELGREKLNEEPDSVRALFEHALQLFWSRDYRECLDVAEKGLEIDSGDWQLLNLKGLASMRVGRSDVAERTLEKAVEAKSDEPDLYNNLGSVLIENNRLERALSVIRKGIELNGGNSNLLRNAASVALALDDMDSAEEYINRAREIDPFIAEAHAISAEVHLRKGEREKAVRDLERIEFLPETSVKVCLKAVQLYVDLGMVGQAEKVLEQACRAYPGDMDLLYLRGKIAELKGDFSEALAVYRKLARMNPDDGELKTCMGCVFEKMGELEKALECFRKASELMPEKVKAEVNIGIICEKMGRDKDAEERFSRALEKDPDLAFAHNAYGCFLARRGRYGEAIRSFTSYIQLEPSSLQGYMNLGRLCEQMNLPEKAVEIYRSIPVSDPELLPPVKERIDSLTAVLSAD